MVEKTDKNPRGAGRPKIPDELKKVNLTVKVPGWVKKRIVDGKINASGLVSGLLVGYFKGKTMKRFQEKACRIERVISMEGAVGDGSVNEELKDFFRDNEDELIVKVFGELPNDLEYGLEDSWMLDDCIAEFVYQQGKTGFLCEFACPEKTPTPSGGYRFSWGCYYTQWVYGKTMEEALNAGFAWVDGMNVKDRVKEA